MLAAALALLAGAAAAQPVALALSGDRQLDLTTTKAVLVTLPRDATDVLVADLEVAEIVIKTPRLAYLIGLKPGDTNAFFLDAAGNRILTLDIRVEKDLTALRRMLDELLPSADISLRAINGDIVLSGEVPSAEVAEDARLLARRFVEDDSEVINLMRVTRPEQVLIQVRVAEMRRSIAKKLGVSLFGRNGDDSFRTGAPALGTLFNDAFGQTVITGSIGGFETLQAMIEALEAEGYVKTLAEPNLTAMSGESANFLAGGEFPVPVGEDDRGRITLEFKPFGVSLRFTPVVLDNGRISMRIATEVSALSDEGAFELASIRVPGLTVRRAETAVEIPSGGSLVLGGLLRNDAANQLQGLPWLADLPILGALFRSSQFQRDETELVVIAVPYIVRPADPRDLTLPTDGFASASDLDHYLLGRLYERYSGPWRDGAPPAGSFGYIVE